MPLTHFAPSPLVLTSADLKPAGQRPLQKGAVPNQLQASNGLGGGVALTACFGQQ